MVTKIQESKAKDTKDFNEFEAPAPPAPDPAPVLPEAKAKGAVEGRMVHWIMAVSMTLTIVAFVIAYLVIR